ncbi:MAG TPA: START domain-containing protein [Chthoniobacterales bacterium]|nr:START domain-containing protein [Chthoniobacterales bacterium]
MRNLLLLSGVLAGSWICGNLRAANPEPSAEWVLISKSDDIAIYRRPRSGPGHNESKVIGAIAAPTEVVHAVIDDIEAYSQFMPYTVECRVLKRDADSVLTYQRISAPLVSDRDYTLRVRTTVKTVEGGKSYFSRWETENALGPAEKRGVVRVNLCEGSWLLEPVGPNSTRATYMIYTDSGAALPDFIKNTGSQIGLRKMFVAVRKQARDPKYAVKQ